MKSCSRLIQALERRRLENPVARRTRHASDRAVSGLERPNWILGVGRRLRQERYSHATENSCKVIELTDCKGLQCYINVLYRAD